MLIIMQWINITYISNYNAYNSFYYIGTCIQTVMLFLYWFDFYMITDLYVYTICQQFIRFEISFERVCPMTYMTMIFFIRT